jgi:hypothetical protein
MGNGKSFAEILEDAEKLTPGEQEELLDILSRRIAERRRLSLAQDVRSARSELRKGWCRPAMPGEFMAEIVS